MLAFVCGALVVALLGLVADDPSAKGPLTQDERTYLAELVVARDKGVSELKTKIEGARHAREQADFDKARHQLADLESGKDIPDPIANPKNVTLHVHNSVVHFSGAVKVLKVAGPDDVMVAIGPGNDGKLWLHGFHGFPKPSADLVTGFRQIAVSDDTQTVDSYPDNIGSKKVPRLRALVVDELKVLEEYRSRCKAKPPTVIAPLHRERFAPQ